MHRCTFLLGFFMLMVSIPYAQSPEPRSSGHFFYFKPTRSILLFDGYDVVPPASGKSEIWEWKNGIWKKIDSNLQPLRSLSAAAFMTGKDQIFIYGGIGKKGPLDSLRASYVYSINGWRKVSDTSIGTRDHHEMAYDEANDIIVMYGGLNGQRKFDTLTWIFKNNRWESLNIVSPGPRGHHAMAYDSKRKKIVLYGGYGPFNEGNRTYEDTWEFDGKTWACIQTISPPGPRGHISMTYDPVSEKILLYGGTTKKGVKGDLWTWDGKEWKQLNDSGPERILTAMAVDPGKNKLYLFGGSGGNRVIYSDLWEWNGIKWTKVNNGETYKFNSEKNKYIKVSN